MNFIIIIKSSVCNVLIFIEVLFTMVTQSLDLPFRTRFHEATRCILNHYFNWSAAKYLAKYFHYIEATTLISMLVYALSYSIYIVGIQVFGNESLIKCPLHTIKFTLSLRMSHRIVSRNKLSKTTSQLS